MPISKTWTGWTSSKDAIAAVLLQHLPRAMIYGDLFAGLPTRLPEEFVETLASSPSVRIERIVSTGQCSPQGFWYDQEQDEWVVLLKGEATLEFADRDPMHLNPGMHVLIRAHEKHRVQWTAQDQPTVWLAVFFDARE